MATSTEQINQLIGGYTDLKAYFEDERVRIEAARNAALGDVADAVEREMHYDVLLDPDIATNVANREFASLTEIVQAAPAGGYLTIRIPGDKVVDFDAGCTVRASSFFFRQEGSGGNPRINVKSHSYDGQNRLHVITAVGGGYFYFNGVDISIENKADPGLGWRTDHSAFIRTYFGSPGVFVGLEGNLISGPADVAVTSEHLGSIVNVGLRTVTVDTTNVVQNTYDGAGIIAANNVTLVNGGEVAQGRTSPTIDLVGNF